MNTKEKLGLLLGILAIIAIGVALAGCQTMAGACRDIESAARYGHDHLSVDE